VIVDDDGNFYGYLTANRFHPQRTRIKLYVTLTDQRLHCTCTQVDIVYYTIVFIATK